MLGNGECVIHFDSEITDRAFQFRVPEEKLNGPEIARFLVNLRRLRPPIECVP